MKKFCLLYRLDKFFNLVVDQLIPAYFDGKCVGSVLIPKELNVFISNPLLSDTMLWFATDNKFGSCNTLIEGLFSFTVCSLQGVAYQCSYNPKVKRFSKIIFQYDGDFKINLSKYKCSINYVSELLNMSLLDTLKHLKSRNRVNAKLMPTVDLYIQRMET